jgi:adhesin transport system membrane fusion protein
MTGLKPQKAEANLAPITQKSLQMVRSPYTFVKVAQVLLITLIISIFLLAFVPWQQTIPASGRVTVFSPMQRPQTINAQIDGRLKAWFIKEGDTVKAGQIIAELEDIKPEYLDPSQLKRYKDLRLAYENKKIATQKLFDTLQSQQSALGSVRNAAVSSAGVNILQADNRLIAARQTVTSAEQNWVTAKLNLDRRKQLFQDGLRSKRDLELAEFDAVKAQADLEAAKAQLEVAQNSITGSRFDLSRISSDTLAKMQDNQAKTAEAIDKLAAIDGEIAKIDVDVASLEQRISQRLVKAPMDGQLVRAFSVGPGQTLKAGEPLGMIAPTSHDQAVELYVSDNDAPLLSVGSIVRVQFAGWPAIQFTGWPSVAVGTFAGKVAVIDAIDDGATKFRVLVKPDQEAIDKKNEEPWPSPRFLRPGGHARGWILLNQVPLGFELWRQFNGFPPTLTQGALYDKANGKGEKSDSYIDPYKPVKDYGNDALEYKRKR